MGLRTVGVKLMADVSGYVSGMQRAKASTTDFKGELDKAAKKGNLDAVADRAAVAGVALVGMAGYAIKSAADFEKSMSGIAAATHASAGEIGKLRAAALQAGKDTSFSATEAADGITELSKAGVSTANILGGGLKGALDLAAAGQLSVGEAAETAASALTQFKLQGSQVPHIADLLAAAAGKAQGSVHDMGYALNQSGLVAAQFGLTIEDTTGTLAEFASAGLTGSDAGTSFKTMLLAMANPAGATKRLMDDLGISFYDAQGKFIGISGVAQVLQERLKDLTAEQRNQALGQIFGNDAIRAASILYTDGAKGVDKWKSAVNDAGYASQTAQIQTNNLSGDIERLKGSLETLAIQSGGGGAGGLRVVAKGLNEIVDQFGRMPSAVGSAITVIAAGAGTAALVLAAWVKLRKGIAAAVEQLEATGPAGEKAAAGLQKSASAAGKAALAFAALEVGSAVLNSLDSKGANVDRLTDSLINLSNTGQSAGEMKDVFGKDWDKLGRIAMFAESAKDGYGHFVNSVAGAIPVIGDAGKALGNFGSRLIAGTDFDTATQQMQSLDTAMTSFMTTTNDATKSSELWQQVQGKVGLSAQELSDLLPNAYKKVGELNAAAEKAKDGLNGQADASKKAGGAALAQAGATQIAVDKNGNYATAADAAAAAAQHQGDALKQLSKFMREQADPVFALLQGERDLKKAQDDAAEAIRKHGVRSKEAKDATEKLADAAIDLQSQVGALGAEFDGKMSPALLKTMRSAGLTDAQIKILAGEFKDAKTAADKYDGNYAAKATAPGAVDAKQKMADAWAAAKGFEGTYTAKLVISGDKVVDDKLADLLIKQRQLASGLTYGAAASAVQKDLDRNRQKGYHAGGWTGPGGTYDTAGVVHADEFVIKKSSRRQIEAQAPGMLEEMNATGQAPGYALGGRVAWPMPTTAAMTKIPTEAQVLAAVGGVAGGSFGQWPGSPGAQRGDSGVWHRILSLVQASGIPYEFGNSYRAGDPLWHGSGRAIDFMGYNQDRLAQFFMSRMGSVLELIHRSDSADYGITRGHRAPMPHQWPLHRNHLHVAMKNGGTITEPVTGVGASGRTYSFGENGQPERVIPNWQAGNGSGGGGMNVTINLTAQLAAGANIREAGRQIAEQLGAHLGAGGTIPVRTRAVTL